MTANINQSSVASVLYHMHYTLQFKVAKLMFPSCQKLKIIFNTPDYHSQLTLHPVTFAGNANHSLCCLETLVSFFATRSTV
jgi:hypothetical protein